MMLAPINTADKVYTIDVSGLSAGALAANAFAGFESPAARVVLAGGVTKNIAGASGSPWGDTAFLTRASGRDQEVSFKMAETYQGCTVYLRYDGTRAVYIRVDRGGDVFSVEYMKTVGRILQNKDVGTDTGVGGTKGVVTANTALSALTGGVYASSDVWTFGAVGDLFYAKFNGVTFWSKRFWTHTVPGKIAVLYEANDGRGYNSVTCTFKPQSVTYSDFANKRFDLRDWGFKDSKTTGSMTAGSYDLTGVPNPQDFEVGDPIIVETGGEAGAGAQNTVGVGGTWPTQSYANAAALPNATTWRTANTGGADGFVWVVDTGKVWINYLSAGVPTWGEFTPINQARFYYWNRVMPRALCATITGKSGNTLTLNKAAAVATTNANVYYDCSGAILAFSNQSASSGGFNYDEATDLDIVLPRGVYAAHGAFYLGGTTSKWRIVGPGRANMRFYSPKGTQVIEFGHFGSDNEWSDLSIQSWAGKDYWCWDNDGLFVSIDYSLHFFGNANNLRDGEYRCKATNVDLYNTWGGVVFEVITDGLATNCRAFHTNGNLQQYFGWYFGQAYCKNTFHVGCEYYADKIGNAFEIFQANGGGFKNCISRNGYVASNFSGGDWLMENWDIAMDYRGSPFTENRWNDTISMVINLNVNIGGGAQIPALLASGGRIVNPDITIYEGEDGTLRTGIVANTQVVAVRITGTHTAKPGKGTIRYIRSGATPVYGEWSGVSCDESTTITGIRVSGLDDTVSVYGGIRNYRDPITGATNITNCVADSITSFRASDSTRAQLVGTDGNITNTAYDALP